ncbi:50S ribosomal protein L13 [archaeon]|nr:50S ribosomal protein L13 [archaeon]|tara:strand:- start:658 stop:1086 length:429 start_codon:yes stop_codon:yes gene_type:complete
MMQTINANGLVMGRLAAYCAKQALLGEKLAIINCKDVIITGDPKRILLDVKERRNRGDAFQGPFFPRSADRIMKRVIRGMLPHKKPRGSAALDNIRCYVSIPSSIKIEDAKSVPAAKFQSTKALKWSTLGVVGKSQGVKNHG